MNSKKGNIFSFFLQPATPVGYSETVLKKHEYYI